MTYRANGSLEAKLSAEAAVGRLAQWVVQNSSDWLFFRQWCLVWPRHWIKLLQ